MSRKYFGTDGVRGRANQHPMTASMALRLGQAVGQYFQNSNQTHRVVIGKDTRRSGYMIENALTAGLTSVGMDVFLLGPVPTPAIGILTRNMRADLGVMISASHNPAEDNGIKFFGPDGFKLSDEAEMAIEAILDTAHQEVDSTLIGSAKRIDDGLGRYIESAKMTFPKHLRLDGLKIVIDAANGAAYRAAPNVLWELGAEIVPIGVNPNGYNINKDCGSTATQNAAMTVVASGADIGIALDGDADRIALIDETGALIDGDRIMGLIASEWHAQNRLAQGTLVTTIMSNLGLERYLQSEGIKLERTQVGDRYVVDLMKKNGFNLGGEQSGHIVMTDYVTTGDGLIAALQFLSIMLSRGAKASELAHSYETVPQKLVNLRYRPGQAPLELESVQAKIAAAEKILEKHGRLVIRKSGTEPLIRIMAESDEEALIDEAIGIIEQEIKNVTK